LLEQLRPKLVPGWRDFEPLRTGVKITISDILFPKLPEQAYSETECEEKTQKVYLHVYDSYADQRMSVYV
jgi:hypothetical protein